jgi:ferritin-like metal-binding protein YciE
MGVNTFQELFLDEMKDVYDAEHRIVRALPKMIEKAGSDALRTALENHLRETEQHVQRLERGFEQLGESPKRRACKAMEGLLNEGDELMKGSDDENLRDAAIIAAAQKVEHYEMATYGTLREWARQLGYEDLARTLQETLDEEGKADKKLTELSGTLNLQAAETDGQGELDEDDTTEYEDEEDEEDDEK